MHRLTLSDVQTSVGPEMVGACGGDTDQIARLVNQAQRRLVSCVEVGDSGWWGGWAEIVFTVSIDDPFFTCPPEIARLEQLAICQRPVQIQNQFFELMTFGIGPQKTGRPCRQFLQVYERNNSPTFYDIIPPNKAVRVFSSAVDAGKRTLIGCLDSSGAVVYSQDGLQDVTGLYLELTAPFAQTPIEVSKITGIQKDTTVNPVSYYEVNLATGDLKLLLTMQPWETSASYRRLYFAGIPKNCCPSPNNPTNFVTITAIAKLELLPVRNSVDYLLIQNLEAIICEMQAIRFGRMDNGESQQMALLKHKEAIRYLQGELVVREGKTHPAIEFKPFGSATLTRANVGTLI